MSLGVKLAFSLPVATVGLLMVVSSCTKEADAPEKNHARTAIEQCWRDQSAMPAESRVALRSSCQNLEFEFKTRFGENP